VEDHNLIEPVHELRRKVAAGCSYGSAVDLLVNVAIAVASAIDSLRPGKAYPGAHQPRHLTCAEIGCHDNHAPRKVDSTIVTQRQRSFIKNAEQQLPQRIRGFFNLVKKD